MVEQIAAIIDRVIHPSPRPFPDRQPSREFWKDFNEDLEFLVRLILKIDEGF